MSVLMQQYIESRVRKIPLTGCWEWTMATSNSGYGVIRWKGAMWSAHRFSYVAWCGEIQDDLCLDHLCRNRKCCNPEHLEAVSMATNVRRGNSTKLTEQQVRAIRILRRSGMTLQCIADAFGVTYQNIHWICKGRNWKTDDPMSLSTNTLSVG